MRRSNWLIADIRRDTENTGVVTAEAGISDEAILQSINDGQTWLFSELEKMNPIPFTAEVGVDMVAGTSEYALPLDTYLGTDVVAVSIKRSSSATATYDRLTLKPMIERLRSDLRGTPVLYYLRQTKFVLNPTPNVSLTDGILLNYTRKLPRVDKRRAKITAITLVNGEVTALTVNVADFADYFPDNTEFSEDAILIDDYFSIVDADGNVVNRKIPITAINSTTGVATITNYTALDDSYTGSVGDYLVAGAFSSSHPQLPDEAESFLIQFAKSQVFEADGNGTEAASASARAHLLGQTTINGWAKLFDDVERIPIINQNNL